MTDKEIKKLSRAELLQMLIQLSQENEDLRAQVTALEEQLTDRSIKIGSAGSIAEASLQLNGVFAAAEASVAQYLENITNQEELFDSKRRAAEDKAEQIVAEAQRKAAEYEAQAKRNADAYWQTISQRLDKLYDDYGSFDALTQAEKSTGAEGQEADKT